MTTTAVSGSWPDVLGEGRAPRFVLICLGVWLAAADSLVATTIMPSVGRALGGFEYFGWATAGFLLGSVLAGASSGLLAQRFGLGRATAAAAVVYALGCALSAAGPDIWTFLIGRLLQGVGGGWVMGFCSVAIGLLFPDRTLPRVYAAVSAVWGVAALLGPMIGGVFADLGIWRWVFWFFAIQGVAVGLAAIVMLPASEEGGGDPRVAWAQLGLVALGVGAIGLADIAGRFSASAVLTLVGVILLIAMVWYDERALVRLLPAGSGKLGSVAGIGFAAMFLVTAASMGYSVYGPAILQTLGGLTALQAGYAVASESVAWTLTALLVAQLPEPWPGRMIRLGGFLGVVAMVLGALTFPSGSVVGAVATGLTLGCGFGVSYSFMSQRILSTLSGAERGTGAAAMTTIRLTGSAAGAAMSAAVANLVGVTAGMTPRAASAAGFWVFASVIPIALLGFWAAWRLGAGQDPGGSPEVPTVGGAAHPI
ncbi:MAG: MFS transporter [Proteobacteria bacterium]|nr:MFS transporter [Pseudomonadota bacterium]